MAGLVPLLPVSSQPEASVPNVPSPRNTSFKLPVNFKLYTTPFLSWRRIPLSRPLANVSSRKPPATCSLFCGLVVPMPTF